MELQDTILLNLPCKADYVSVARLTASGIASRIGFDIDTVEDIKVAVSEVCSRIINAADTPERHYEIQFYVSTIELKINFFSDIEKINCLFENDEDGLGMAIIDAFMDEVEYCPDNRDHILTMTKYFKVVSSNG